MPLHKINSMYVNVGQYDIEKLVTNEFDAFSGTCFFESIRTQMTTLWSRLIKEMAIQEIRNKRKKEMHVLFLEIRVIFTYLLSSGQIFEWRNIVSGT